MGVNPYSYVAGYPKDFQIVDGYGQLTPAWQYFFQALWAKTGGGSVSVQNTYTVIESPAGPIIAGPGPSNGVPVGQGTKKAAPVLQTLNTSPWTFTAAENGFMTLPGGQINYSRDGSLFYKSAMTGGQIMILSGDTIQVVWYGARPSPVVWWPGGF